MKNRLKDIAICCTFFFIIVFFMIASIVTPDVDLSKSERRKLAKPPKMTLENVMDGSYLNKLETYSQEQFFLRDYLRGIKSFTALKVLKKQDNNKLFLVGDDIYRIEYPLNEKSILTAAEKLNKIYDMYLDDTNNCYYTIIPDKSYYTAQDKLYMDYERLQKIMQENVKNMKYINLFDVMTQDNYYSTDSHWKQESLQNVVDSLAKNMNFTPAQFATYKKNILGEFGGVYYGQLSMNVKKDKLCYLTNDILDKAYVYNYEKNEEMPVYTLDKFTSDVDPYNVFLSGPVTLVTLNNSDAKTEKELIIFRDSFASSIAPMLLESYKTITLVDLRYISASLLKDYIDFENKDILFMYSTTILNNSAGLRI